MLALLAVAGCRALEAVSTPPVPYTILDGDTSILVDGDYDTVGEVLAAAGAALGEADSVSPAPSRWRARSASVAATTPARRDR